MHDNGNVNAYLDYTIPGRFDLNLANDVSDIEINDTVEKNLNFTFYNVLSEDSCHINLEVLNPLTISNMKFDCYGKCIFFINTTKLQVRNFTLLGIEV